MSESLTNQSSMIFSCFVLLSTILSFFSTIMHHYFLFFRLPIVNDVTIYTGKLIILEVGNDILPYEIEKKYYIPEVILLLKTKKCLFCGR